MNIIQMMFWLIIKLINNIFTMKRAYHIIIQKAIAEINKFCQKKQDCAKKMFFCLRIFRIVVNLPRQIRKIKKRRNFNV